MPWEPEPMPWEEPFPLGPQQPMLPAPEFYKNLWTPAIDPAISEVLNLRQEANTALGNATNQYEADIADFKNIQATEAEQGIGSLPEFRDASPELRVRGTNLGPSDRPMSPQFDPNLGQPKRGIPNDPFANSFLNSGLSQLPSNQQNDTLTTQVFQSGFRPNRKRGR